MANTARQSVAQSLSEWLHRHGCWTTSPLPLAENARLRFSCQSAIAHHITAELNRQGHCCRFAGVSDQPRPAVKRDEFKSGGSVQQRTHAGLVSCTSFEIDLARDQRSSGDEVASQYDHRKRRKIDTSDIMAE